MFRLVDLVGIAVSHAEEHLAGDFLAVNRGSHIAEQLGVFEVCSCCTIYYRCSPIEHTISIGTAVNLQSFIVIQDICQYRSVRVINQRVGALYNCAVIVNILSSDGMISGAIGNQLCSAFKTAIVV